MRQRSTNTVKRHAADKRRRLSGCLLMSDGFRLSDHSLREHKTNGGVTCQQPRRTARPLTSELASCFALPSATAQLRTAGRGGHAMPELHLPWMELSIVVPLLGAVLMGFVRDRELARKLCIAICLVTLALATGEWLDFNLLDAFEAHDHGDLFAALFHRDVFVIDELSSPLLPLAALLYLMTVLSTLKTKVNRFSFGWTLFSEAVLLATFSCREGWTLIGLLALGTLPPWIELRKRRHEVTRVYSIHMGLFVGMLVVGWWLLPNAAIENAEMAGGTTMLAGALITAAALIRSGIAPLHCWMTDLFERATFGTALLFVAPMPGAYAIMRLVLPIAPSWALQSIAVLSLVTSVYAAAMALAETDARRFFCYLFLSHSSLVLVGLELVTPIGLTGALCVWLSVGLSLGGFGLTMRSIEARMGRISLSQFHGLYEHTPTLAAMFLLTGLASIGFPGTIGFIGTELLIEGAVGVYPFIGMAVVIAAALNGIAILYAYFRIFTGTRLVVSIPFRAKLSERIALLILTALILGGGLYPQPGVSSRYHAATALLAQRGVPVHRHGDESATSDQRHSHSSHIRSAGDGSAKSSAGGEDDPQRSLTRSLHGQDNTSATRPSAADTSAADTSATNTSAALISAANTDRLASKQRRRANERQTPSDRSLSGAVSR